MGHFDDKKNIENQTLWIRHLLKAYFIAFSKSHTLVYKLNKLLQGKTKLRRVLVMLTGKYITLRVR